MGYDNYTVGGLCGMPLKGFVVNNQHGELSLCVRLSKLCPECLSDPLFQAHGLVDEWLCCGWWV